MNTVCYIELAFGRASDTCIVRLILKDFLQDETYVRGGYIPYKKNLPDLHGLVRIDTGLCGTGHNLDLYGIVQILAKEVPTRSANESSQ
ncbi:5835_t:CDS:2 [Cetraspora pellucida]|uniref:5835_t:CDS:1 n=1 Tax=Cetraspora pellucida TaxID=1433469 RepID=A0ACA9KGN9_9GLOM|nr:5835_t:CDS:2 [Cetraspora pellucida]